MSEIYKGQYPGLAGIDFDNMSKASLEKSFFEILKKRIHGISFSAYLEGQGPGSQISEGQIRERMKILQPYVKWVRSFSCVDGNELIPKIAHEYGLKTLVGAWLGDDKDMNEDEINALIKVAEAGYADIIAVGNEVLLRGDMSEDEIMEYMNRVRKSVPGTQLGYVDAYYKFAHHPRICDLCDVLLVNCYPFWEGFPREHSLAYVKNMYQIAKQAAGNKKVIISETGWPDRGSAIKEALPSYENAIKYFINIYNWAGDENIDIFYFASFDETWKVAAEGDVGAYWGLWDKDGNLKYC